MNSYISSFEMKNFLKTSTVLIFLFGVFSFAYDGVVLWLMHRSPSCTAVKIKRAVNGGDGEKIAIFGSSRALGNYAPSFFSEKAFNYGVNGMSVNEALLLVCNYLRNNETDSTVIINIDPWGGAKQGEFEFVGDYRLVAGDGNVRSSMPELNIPWPDWVPGLRFQGTLRAALTQYINARKGMTKKVDNGSELLLRSRTKAEWSAIKKTLEHYSFFDVPRKQLDEIYAVQDDHLIVWVVTPSCKAHHDYLNTPEALKGFLARQSKRRNVMAFNYFDETMDYPDSLFADPTHFNIEGAGKFTRELDLALKTVAISDKR